MNASEQSALTIDTTEAKARLVNLVRYGDRVHRFARALAGELKPVTTVDGFVWSIERALRKPEEKFEEFDRIRIRNEMPQILQSALPPGVDAFHDELLKELAAVRKQTLNFS